MKPWHRVVTPHLVVLMLVGFRKPFKLKWAREDSNLRPADYESAALTG